MWCSVYACVHEQSVVSCTALPLVLCLDLPAATGDIDYKAINETLVFEVCTVCVYV